jgi:folate-binding protein YgfZ
MSHCQAALLADRGIVRVAGEDARKFLQGLITNNMDKVAQGKAIHAGLLSPQGKILFDFFVVADDGAFLLDVARDKAAELARRLGFYKLRAEVMISEKPDATVVAAWGSDAPHLPQGVLAYADPRLPELGSRVVLPGKEAAAELGCERAAADDYHARRIALGVPEGGRDYGFGDAFPHEALFDQLDGVDFTKGCFIGQEVVSRMEHRGTARSRIVPVEGNLPLPAAGTEVMADGLPLGTLGSVSGTRGLAMLRLDRAEQALSQGKALKAAGVTLTLHRPAFARFAVPAAKVSA